MLVIVSKIPALLEILKECLLVFTVFGGDARYPTNIYSLNFL